MKDYSDIVNRGRNKKKEEENVGSSSSSNLYDATSTIDRVRYGKKINFDTLESDLNTLGSTISNVYSGWQDADTMANTRTSVEDMQKRLGSYQEYQKKYGGADLSDIASGYQSVLDDWDNLSSVYGYYQNADAYNSAVKKSQMDKDFGGLSYDDVQSKLKEYKEGSDEHKYLSEYMGYSDLRDFDKALSNAANGDYKEKLQAERNKYALDNNFDLYKDYLNAEDYEENSKYKGSPYKGALGGLWDRITSEEADVYEHAGMIQKAKAEHGENYDEAMKMLGYNKPRTAGLFGSVPEGMENATDEELGVYFQIANTEGMKKALDYAKSMEVTWSKRAADQDAAREQEWLESGNGVTRKLKQGVVSALSVPASLVGKVEGAVDDIGNILTGQELNPYSYHHSMMNSTQNVQSVTGENIKEYTEENDWIGTDVPFIGNVWSSLYGDAMSIGENALGIATLGPAYGYVAAGGAFTTKAKELKEAGATDEQIRNGAIASAVFEYIGERIGIERLFKIKNVDSFGKLIKNIPGQMIPEAGEEMFTEFLNIAGDYINRGAMSDAAQKYQEYLDRGFSKEEAWKNTASDLGSQIAKSGISGAFSGAVMGGGYSGIQYYNNAKTGQTIRDNNAVTDLQDVASGLKNEAYADYLKLIEGNKISNAKLGNLYTEVENEVSENYKKEKSNAQMRPMADRAIELGDTKNSGMIASAVTKYVNGEKLSAEEKAMLKTDTAQTILADAKRGDIQVKATDSLNKAMDNATKMRNIVEMPIDEKARRSRVAELNVGEVTEVTSTGNSTKIDGIRVEDGSTIVLTSEGEVKEEDMTFSAKDAEMLSYAENMSPDKANLFLSQYDGKVDVEDYRNSFNMAYSYGEVGFAADTVLKNKGVLTEVQASEIYKQSLKMASDRKQKVIDEINEKQKGNTFVKGTFDDSIINYKGNTTDKNKVSWSKLTPQQRSAITFAKGFSKATGVNIKFIKSNVVNGEHKGKNGRYKPSTNTIEIDVYAGRIDAKSITDSIVPTLSHEVTHWMKAKSPAMYNKMKEHIAETLAMNDGKTIEQRVDDEMVRMKSAHSKMNVTPEMAIDEIIARSCEDMLSNSEKARELLNGLTKAEQNDLVSKIKDAFKNLIKWVNDLLNTYKSNSEEAKILREYESRLKELSKMWDEALTKAIEANQSLQHEGVKGEQAIGENLFTKNTAQLSIRTYENEGKALLHDWLNKSDLDDDTKKEIMEQMDHVYDVATKYAADSDLIDFSSWSESDVIRRDNGTPILTVVVPNGEYPLNIDFSQICKKRKALNSVLNALVRSGDLDMRTLSQSDIGNINRIIKEHGFEIACALCFVDSKRYRVNEWADSFADTYNKLVDSLTKGTEYKADEFNYTGRKLTQPKGKILKNADDSELNFDYINEVLAKNSSGKAIYRYALAIKNNKELRSRLNSSEIISSAGLDAIKVQNEALYALVNSHQGSAKPKLSHSENPYGYEILLDERFNAEDAYKVGGVRIQSFSDYMANMFFDYVQMIGDLAAKQLPAHAYTKEYYFAKLFGLTGIKINLSIVPKGANITDEQKTRFNKMTKAAKEKDAEFKALKAHAGLDADGNYILEDETFPLDKALELQNTEGYDKNCGIIWVGVSDKHIEKMLDDDNVPFIIPYHKSSLNPAIARMRNIDFYNDYTKAQNTRYDSKAKKKVPSSVWSFDFYADLSKTNDPRQTAENYKTECKNRGYLPKFDAFKDHPNYYKLLVDFRVYDKAGNYAPQGAVRMAFPDDFNKIVGESLAEAQDTQKRLDADMKDLLDEIRSELKLGHEQYSDRDSEGNQLTKEQMEYFKDSKVIAFDSNQIKNTTNTNPTEDSDIRYSDRKLTRSEANKLAREKVATYKEQIEKKAKIESITQKALVLNRWMLKNSKDEHIPEAMKPVVSHLLQAIDFSSKQYLGMRGGKHKGMPTKTDLSIAQALADVQKMMSEAKVDGEILFELYGADLDADMADLVKSVNLYARTVGDNEYVLNQMTLDELHYLDKIVGAIKTSVSQMNRFHVANSKKGIAATAQMDMLSMKALGQIELPKTKLGKGVSELLNWGNINPYFAFKRFGEGGKAIFTALQDGWDKFAFNVKKIIEYAKKTYTNDEVKEWSEEVHEFDVLLPATKDQLADPNFKGNRKMVQMTTAQIMSLYCLQKRDQAKGHISGGGIRITDIETKKGIISQSEGVTITEKELDKIIGKLTSRQKEVADALQKFMNEDCTVWGNEISMARFGYKALGEKNYFPIKSDENVTNDDEVKEKEKTLYRLLNMSFTKALKDKANNRIVVDNIFDVFAQHTSEMAKYNAMALPVLDAVRWFNYKEKGLKVDTHFDTYSIKQAMEKAYGKDAKKYVNTFLEDLNGADNVGRDSLAKGFFSNAKIASVAFNLKVAALQLTSYLRASVVIDPKYLTKAMNPKNVKDGIDKAKKYCGMAYWKSLGFYDTNIQRGVTELIKHDKSTKDKITEASMKGAEKMDEMTWGCLWNACEMMMKDTRQDLEPGTDEFYKEVGKKLREVIYATQVVDSTMTRSQMMRSPDRWDKVLTNFASEQTLSYNMLMDVFFDWQMEARRTNKSNAFSKYKGKMARVAAAYTATNLVTALLETAFMAYRDDDEEEEDFVEYVKSFLENFGSNMGITTKIPYVKDLISVIQGFSSDRMDTQWIQKFVYACKDWLKIFNGEGNVYKAVYRTLDTASQVSGLPMSNAMRELASVWNLTIGNMFPSLKLYK